jgi:MFS family permease
MDQVARSDQASPPVERPWPPPRQAWWAVFVFSLVLTVQFLDRGLLGLLVEPIKRDLHLTDTQISAIMGFAFVIFYVLLGLPISRWIDSGSRRLVLGLSVVVWSVSTMLCGAAHGFWQLALCRVGVGAGDAAVSPAISSMISDLFPRERLPRAMSLMAFAFVVGNGVSLLFGGGLVHALEGIPAVHLPILGQFFPWQITFLIVGAPGLLISLMFFTTREPARRGLAPGQGHGKAPPAAEILGFLRANWAVYAVLFGGLAFRSTLSVGMSSWTPAFFHRTYGWSAGQYGITAGIMSLGLSPIGLLVGYRITEWLHRRGHDDANLRLTAICAWVTLPAFIAMPLMPSPWLALALTGWASLVSTGTIGSENAAMLAVTPNRMRGQISALYLFIYNCIGYGLGPVIIALLTDVVFHDEAKLRYALLLAAAVMGPIGAAILTVGLKPYGRAFARSAGWQ